MNSKTNLNILILHAHWNNRGDEAAIRAMIDSLKSHLIVDNIEIMVMTEEVIQFPYDDMSLIKTYPSNLVELADSFLMLLTFGNISLLRNGRDLLKSVNNSSIVIHAPGGPSIGDMYGKKLADYSYLFRLMISIMKSKPLFFYAPSVGPFYNPLLNILRRFIFEKSKLVVVREEISAKYLEKQLNLNAFVTADSALQNKISPDYIEKNDNVVELVNEIKEKKIVGITITNLKWHPKYGNFKGMDSHIIKVMSETIEYLLNKNYAVLLIPQLFGKQNDIKLLEKFKKRDSSNIFILPEDVDSYAQQILISKLYCVIGMRYHSNIFAAKGNVPFISIYYEHKMKGFMEKIGLPDLAINVENLSEIEVVNKFIYLEENYNSIKLHLENENPQLKECSLKTTELIINELKNMFPSKIKKCGE